MNPPRKSPAFRLWHVWLAALAAGNLLAGADTPVPLCLTNAQQIRQLTPEQAEKRIPVRLRGVVTFSDWYADGGIFVQDATAAIYLHMPQDLKTPVGQVVEVEGVSAAGDFVPMVENSIVKPVATAPLPAPHQVSFQQMATGKEDSQWVEVRGVVRSVVPATLGRMRVDLLIDGQRLSALISHLETNAAARLVNAVVRMQGIGRSRFNGKRQLRAPWMCVSGPANLVVETPSPGEPVEVPLTSLLQFNSEGYYGRQVKVKGVVTQQKGGSLFIVDQGRGLFVKAEQTTPMSPGDLVEVIGFPVLGPHAPVVEDAVFRKIGTRPTPVPQVVTANQLLSEDFDAGLVRVRARLVNRVERLDEQILVLAAANLILNAHLDTSKADGRFNELENGSELELTGVCLIQPLETWNPSLPSRPETAQLLLRSQADIVVIRNPPWWTLSRLFWMLAIMTVVLLAGLSWVVVLDRRVRKQTEIIQQKLQREAVLEERSRIAREFHDTLEQELAAITIQLDTVSAQFEESPRVARQLLDLARNMSRRSLVEARRSVWDLRSHLLENSSLVNALTELAKPLAAAARVEILVQTAGTPRKLAVQLENNLLRVAQEAITNALKHAHAAKLIVELTYAPGRIRLRISDDGIGFDVNDPLPFSEGHFGLLDMSERAEKMGGSLAVKSAPGRGTEIVVEVANKESSDASVNGEKTLEPEHSVD